MVVYIIVGVVQFEGQFPHPDAYSTREKAEQEVVRCMMRDEEEFDAGYNPDYVKYEIREMQVL